MKFIHVGGVVSLTVLLTGAGLAAQQPVPSADGAEHAAVVRPAPELAAPRLIQFSGVLKDALGKSHAGALGVTFALYAEPEGGAPLWLETQNVTLEAEGRYTVLLGTTRREGLPLKLFATSEARWLEVQVAGEPPQPRILLVSVPYALKAEDTDKLGGRPASDYALAESLPRAAKPPDDNTALVKVFSDTVRAPKFVATNDPGPGLVSRATSGPPLQVSSTERVANLNADLLDSLDSADLQQRVTDSCALGSAIRVINAEGTVTCETDDAGTGTVTMVDTGTGLTGGPITTAGTLSIDTAVVPRLNANNTFAGDVTVNGQLSVGSGGVHGNGAGFKHKRRGSFTLPGGTSGDVSLTWDTPFADSNYTVSCTVQDSVRSFLAMRLHHIEEVAAGFVTVLVVNDSSEARTGDLHCIAVHD